MVGHGEDVKTAEDLRRRIQLKIKAIDEVSQDLPSILIIHNIQTQSVEYMSERGLRILNTSMDEVKSLGPGYFEKFFNPEDAPNYIPIGLEMLEKNDLNEVFSFFQQVRGDETEDWGWYLSASKVLMLDDDGAPILAITAAHPIDAYKSITSKLQRLIKEREMMHRDIAKFVLLTKREKEIIKLVCNGSNSALIAKTLFIAQSTVEQHRKNIKNKLSIKKIPELVLFAQAFDMLD